MVSRAGALRPLTMLGGRRVPCEARGDPFSFRGRGLPSPSGKRQATIATATGGAAGALQQLNLMFTESFYTARGNPE